MAAVLADAAGHLPTAHPRVLAYPADDRAANPYTAQLHDELRARGWSVQGYARWRLLRDRYDVVSLHFVDNHLYLTPWWRAASRAATMVGLVALARLRGAVVVWTVHNLDPHELRWPALGRLYWRLLARLAHGFVSLSPSGVQAIEDRHRGLAGKPHVVAPIGHVRGAYPDTVARAEARRRLGIAAHARVAAFIGQIRPYKGVPDLLDAFAGVDDPDAVALVAGRVLDDDLASDLERRAAADPRVRLHLGFLPDDELQVHLRAADLVVLPFRRIFNSSSAVLALSFDIPVLVPAGPAMIDLRDAVGEEWVRCYDGRLSPAVLADALRDAAAVASEGRQPRLDALQWSEIGETVDGFYRSLQRRTR